MYNLKKAGMRSKNSCKCSKKLLRALLLVTILFSALTHIIHKPTFAP